MAERNKQHRGWLVALAYFDLLGKPLTLNELRRYLWQRPGSLSEVKQAARPWRLAEDLYGMRPASLAVRQEAAWRLKEYWNWIESHKWVLSWVPFVELVMVMNGVAHGEVNADSDIDLYVATRRGRVWLARGWMLLLLSVLGLRARGSKKAMKFSPEFFVDMDHLNMQGVGSGSVYLNSFWISDFTPILHQENFAKFWFANRWLEAIMPIAWRSPRIERSRYLGKPLIVRGLERLLGGRLGDTIELLAAGKQEKIIRANLAKMGERPDYLINDHTVKIHFKSNRPRVVDDSVEAFLAGSD